MSLTVVMEKAVLFKRDDVGPVRVELVPVELSEGALMDGVMVTLELREVMDWAALLIATLTILGRRVLVPEFELLLSPCV